MKFSRWCISLVIGLFLCFATITSMAHAQDFPPERAQRPGMPGMHGGNSVLRGLMPFLKLNLSQDQQNDLLDIFDKYNDMRKPYMKAMMASGREMADIVEADILDEEKARAVFKKQEAVREEMMLMELKMVNEIKKLLSPEQLEMFGHLGGGRSDRPFLPQGE